MRVWRALTRDWKGQQIQLIVGALVLATAVVSSVAILADRVEGGLSREVSSFLAADLKIVGNRDIPVSYEEKAQSFLLRTAREYRFNSMVFNGDNSHLASVKAVSDLYPLIGKLTIADKAFAASNASYREVESGPAKGEVWAEERLLPILGVVIGDEIEVGKEPLRLTQVLIHEPDRGSGFSVLGARLMMNANDLPATEVIQEGSRVKYGLFTAGEPENIAALQTYVEELDDPAFRQYTPEESEERLSDTIGQGRNFLLLSGTVGVLLAAVALALASQRYAQSHLDYIALMKSWGLGANAIRRDLFTQMALLTLICTGVGILAGWLIHFALLEAIAELLPQDLPAPGPMPFVITTMTGILCMAGFAIPAVWRLPEVPPLKVLNRAMEVNLTGLATRFLIGVIAITSILILYTNNLLMTSAFLLSGVSIVLVLGSIGLLSLKALQLMFTRVGSLWRLAVGNLWRRRIQTLTQMTAFAFAIMLILVMTSMRTSLLADWEAQIPEDAPNHFLINIAEWELGEVQSLMADKQLESDGWYPIVRGRLISQNGEKISDERMEKADGLDREVNLTWAESLPETNEIIEGEWWSTEPNSRVARVNSGSSLPQFSLEKKVATELGTTLGDVFEFNIGGRSVEAQLTSIRTVDWNSMKPNFYIVFSPGVLNDFSANWMTSTHLKQNQKLFINDLLSSMPTILVIALDQIQERIEIVINRVTLGLELMLLMILACGVLVLFAAIASTYQERAQETAILRTLGSSRKVVLGSLTIEFGTMGFLAGLIASIVAQLAIVGLQIYVFEMPSNIYLWLWFAGPAIGMLLITLMGLVRCYSLISTPPLRSLRQLAV